jgi:putative SOS response-associated peptidase YedK
VCGRYASFRQAQDIADTFAIEEVAPDVALLSPSWNIAPTTMVRIVVERADSATGEIRRSLRAARWGLVPSWAKDPSIGNRMINARAETIAEKPAYRRALAARRCLVIADGYYEWQAAAAGRAAKQPFYIRPADGSLLAMAGLYEFWRDGASAAEAPWLVTTTIVTTAASGALAEIHDRRPAGLASEAWDPWLDPAVGADEGARLLSGEGPAMIAIPVSTAVNRAGIDGPELIAPSAR